MEAWWKLVRKRITNEVRDLYDELLYLIRERTSSMGALSFGYRCASSIAFAFEGLLPNARARSRSSNTMDDNNSRKFLAEFHVRFSRQDHFPFTARPSF